MSKLSKILVLMGVSLGFVSIAGSGFCGENSSGSSFADGQELQPIETLYDGAEVASNDPLGLATVHLEYFLADSATGSSPTKSLPIVSCSGTLIAKDVVLTAGHCVTGIKDSAGKANLVIKYRTPSGEVQSTKEKQYAIYPTYKNEGHATTDDIALIQIEDSVKDRNFPPLAGGDDFKDGQELTVAGYGRNSSGDLTSDDMLKDPTFAKLLQKYKSQPNTTAGKTEQGLLLMQIVKRTKDLSEARTPLLRTAMTGKLLASKPFSALQIESRTSAVCEGDSGGPSFVQTESGALAIVGVHSGGSDVECKDPNPGVAGLFGAPLKIGVDVYVPNFATWIKKQVRIWNRQTGI